MEIIKILLIKFLNDYCLGSFFNIVFYCLKVCMYVLMMNNWCYLWGLFWGGGGGRERERLLFVCDSFIIDIFF